VDDLDPSLDPSSAPVWYVDADGDGSPGSLSAACVPDPDGGPVAEDCDDGDRTVFPGAPEVCDLQPNDCDDLGWVSDGETAHWVPAEGPVVDLRPLVRLGATLPLEGSGRLGICTDLNGQIHFTGGAVEVVSDGANLTASAGSALRFQNVDEARVSGLTLEAARAARGSAIDFDAPGASLSLDRVTAYLGSVSTDGAAIWFNGDELLLTETSLDTFEADGDGGLIFLSQGRLVAVDSSLVVGTALRGGALFLSPGTSAELTRTLLSANIASGDGGAIFADQADLVLTDVDTEANEAFRGGVVYANRGSLRATGGSWFGNDAVSGGAGVFTVGQATELTDLTVRAHSSGTLGAFTFQPLGETASVNACLFPADRPNLPFDLAVFPASGYDLVGEATRLCDDSGCR
jgi:predicted outer membrane repeat protein